MKPKGLLETTIAMCLMNIAGIFFVDPRLGYVTIQYCAFSAIIAITYLILWHFWKGRNWARILVLVTGGLAIANLFLLPTNSVLADSLIVVEAIFGAFMLWWLNSADVKNYFRTAPEQ